MMPAFGRHNVKGITEVMPSEVKFATAKKEGTIESNNLHYISSNLNAEGNVILTRKKLLPYQRIDAGVGRGRGGSIHSRLQKGCLQHPAVID